MGFSVRLLSLLLVQNVYSQTGSGIIGFGISFYQDLCCQACRDSLSSLYLSCTTFSNMTGGMAGMAGMANMPEMGMPMATTSPECYASNAPWLQTMAYCIQQNCNARGYPAEKQGECFSNQAVGGASSPTFLQSLPANAPTVELAANATWLNVTSLVNRDVYYSTYGTDAEFARSEYLHTRYALALYLFAIGICVVGGAMAQLMTMLPTLRRRAQVSIFWPKMRQYVFLPALLGSRRLEPLPGQVGYVPRRVLSMSIAIYVALNVVFSAVGFTSFQPNTLFKSKGFELCEYVGNRTGTLSLVNASIAILFAGRNNPLIALTGWSVTTFLTLHRWIARVATVQAVVHSVVYTMAYWQPGYDGASAYFAKVAEPFYWWGIIATICFCLATGFSILPLRINFYETFLVLHIVLVGVALVGCWYHIVPHYGYVFGYQTWLYICFAYWAYERVARLARLAFYNQPGSSRGLVSAIPDSNVMQLTIYPRSVWGFGSGQYSVLYFPGLGKVWESHPFSVAGWTTGEKIAETRTSSTVFTVDSKQLSGKDKSEVTIRANNIDDRDSASVTFLIRAHAGATAQLSRRLASSSSSSFELSVYTEGPYAGHRVKQQSLLDADTVLCIVGGIGITGVLGFVQEYARASSQRAKNPKEGRGAAIGKIQRVVLAWSAREISVIEHVRREFLDDATGIECSFWCTKSGSYGVFSGGLGDDEMSAMGRGVNFGRMDIDAVMKFYLEKHCRTTVVVCGPGEMADEVTTHVVNGVKAGIAVDLVEEAFAW